MWLLPVRLRHGRPGPGAGSEAAAAPDALRADLRLAPRRDTGRCSDDSRAAMPATRKDPADQGAVTALMASAVDPGRAIPETDSDGRASAAVLTPAAPQSAPGGGRCHCTCSRRLSWAAGRTAAMTASAQVGTDPPRPEGVIAPGHACSIPSPPPCPKRLRVRQDRPRRNRKAPSCFAARCRATGWSALSGSIDPLACLPAR